MRFIPMASLPTASPPISLSDQVVVIQSGVLKLSPVSDFFNIGSPSLTLPSLTVTGNLTVNGNTVLGDSPTDTLTVAASATFNGVVSINSSPLTIASSAVTWSGNPTHSGTHTYSGTLRIADGSTGAASLALSSSTNSGLIWDNNQVTVTVSGNRIAAAGGLANGWVIRADAPLSWGASATVNPDVFIFRDASNALAQRNGSNPQNLYVYNTFTDPSNYERGRVGWSGNFFIIGTVSAGTGAARSVGINTDGIFRWQFTAANGHFVPATDNITDIGVSGGTRPRSGYFGTSVVIGNANSGGQLLDVSGGGLGSQGYWSRFRGNVGTTLPAAGTGGLFIGWNRSNAQGETELLFGTSEGAGPYLSFGSWNGTVIAEQVRVLHTANAVNRLSASGSTTGNPVGLGVDGTDTNVGFDLYSKGTGSIRFRTNSSGNNQFVVAHTASAVNYIQATGASTGNGPSLSILGSDTDVNMILASKGAGGIVLQSGAGSRTIATFIDIASSVNFLQFQGSATGNPLEISAVGTDTNISWVYDSKGTGAHTFRSHDGGNGQFQVLSTVSASRWITVTGSNGGNPTIGTSAGNLAFSATTVFLNTGLTVLDIDASHALAIVPGSNITANRTLTLTTGDADRTLTLNGNPTLDDWFNQSVKTTASPTFAQLTLSTAVSKIIPGATSLSMRNNADSADNLILTDAGAATIRTALTVTTTLTVNGTGTSTISGPLSIAGASAGQIAFPASQNASAGANTLDDYEEGTWTPAVAFGAAAVGITYSQQAGNYTKVGNLVTAWFSMALTSKGSSVGNATLTGLPFTIANTSGVSGAEAVNFTNMTATLVSSTLQGNINTTNANIYGIGAAGTTNQTQLTDASFANNTVMVAKMTFRV